ncbi:DUF4198 domain-containing protein [Primorskyibacter sp. S187A]|uniref:DUF4198 domain-containing protein n=1 Tax=Primorskyibacter sp. S187A TaxID=3415130 RepID=UPI003C7E3680
MMKNVLAALLMLAAPASAHEFWIEPHDFQVPGGAPVVADVRVGEAFGGSAFTFNPRNFRRFDLVMGPNAMPVEGRIGDRPALSMPAPSDGLAVIVHETSDMYIKYSMEGQFENFLTHKDWLPLLDVHKSRGLPEIGFVERYSRYGKSLVAVGDGAGADRVVGLTTEIVALANPYTEDLSEMPVQVFYEDAPRPEAQVELFEKAPDGEVAVTYHRTDADGIARLPVKAGHAYLVDAVVIREMKALEEDDPVWESLWASLTFALP